MMDGMVIEGRNENGDIMVDIEEVYEISRTIHTIDSFNYSSIALQFPDEMLCHAPIVASLLEKRSSRQIHVYILADTSYGSCCVDEVAAEHVMADLIVHYGRACLSPTSRLPVLYIFGRLPINVQHAANEFESLYENNKHAKVILMYDVVYHYAMENLHKEITSRGYNNVVLSTIPTSHNVTSPLSTPDLTPSSSSSSSQQSQPMSSSCCKISSTSCCSPSTPPPTPPRCKSTTEDAHTSSSTNRFFTLPESDSLDTYSIFYIGPETLTLTNICITHSQLPVSTYDPETQSSRKESMNVNKLLMRRYFLVQQARDADVVGIVVGTLGVAHYLPLIQSLMKLITKSHKKPYLLSMGKLNPAKLGNFLEIDVFVLVACPENSLLDSKSSGYMKPILTPWELELALEKDKEWVHGVYKTGIKEVLDGVTNYLTRMEVEYEDGKEEEDEPHFSLVTGGLKTSSKYRSQESRSYNTSKEDLQKQEEAMAESMTSLTLRNASRDLVTLSSPAAEYLQTRTWKGLDMSELGQTPVEMAEEGRQGIARGYTHESGKDEQIESLI